MTKSKEINKFEQVVQKIDPQSKMLRAADDNTKKTMREGHNCFITQAFGKLSVQ